MFQKTLVAISGRFTVVKGLLRFFWVNKMWWLIPMVIALLVIGIVLVVGQTSPLGTFIYTIF